MYTDDGCKGGFVILVVSWPFGCRFICYGVWWYGCYDVYVGFCGEREVLCCPVFMIGD